jgi:hypothetical protein
VAGDLSATCRAALVSQLMAWASPGPAPRASCSATCRTGPCFRESLPGVAVQALAEAERKIRVDGVVDQVVAEAQPGIVVFQDPGGDRFGPAHLFEGGALPLDPSAKTSMLGLLI